MADNWKAYYRSFIGPTLRGDVLEVGAGLGATTRALCDGSQRSWLCLEPDRSLAAAITSKIANGELPPVCRATTGFVRALPAAASFDCILYIDVLEHVADDAGEVRDAVARLRHGGHLVILAPAHQCLFSQFDAAIGHYRRYTHATLAALMPPSLRRRRLVYLDSVGLMASLANRWLLRSAEPTAAQIRFWDRVLVPPSRIVDRLLLFRVGRSALGIWRLETDASGGRPGQPPPADGSGR
jgi:SAM-dependent methyltransferase